MDLLGPSSPSFCSRSTNWFLVKSSCGRIVRFRTLRREDEGFGEPITEQEFDVGTSYYSRRRPMPIRLPRSVDLHDQIRPVMLHRDRMPPEAQGHCGRGRFGGLTVNVDPEHRIDKAAATRAEHRRQGPPRRRHSDPLPIDVSGRQYRQARRDLCASAFPERPSAVLRTNPVASARRFVAAPESRHVFRNPYREYSIYVLPVLFRHAINVKRPSSSEASFTGPMLSSRNVSRLPLS